MVKNISYLLLVVGLWTTSIATVFSQNSMAKTFIEKTGKLLIEMEAIEVSGDWVKSTTAKNYTGSGYIYWSGKQYFNETGKGELVYPIQINNAGTYRIIWRTLVGKGEDITLYNDNWLKVNGAQIYGEKPNGHFSEGFQSVPVDWRINSKRKIDFFEKIKEITGY